MLKSHHSAADGIAIRMLGEAIFSDAQRPRKSAPAIRFLRGRLFTRSVLSFPGQLIQFAKSIPGNRAAARAVVEAKSAGEWDECIYESTSTRFNCKVSGSALVEPIILAGNEVRHVKNAVPRSRTCQRRPFWLWSGCAMARYLTEKSEAPRGSLFAMVPRSMRKQEEWESANQLVNLSREHAHHDHGSAEETRSHRRVCTLGEGPYVPHSGPADEHSVGDPTPLR